MLVYAASKNEFINDIRSNRIEEIINNEVSRKLNRNSPRNEILSWKNSLQYMFNILIDESIPGSSGVAIEYNIPLTNRRIDFLITGRDENRDEKAIVIELKQWSVVEKTEKDGVVRTYLNGAIRETNHPSYQAWSYAALINDYNETVRKEAIEIRPCAYLHNLKSRKEIEDILYKDYIDRAPIFISQDAFKLSEFLKKYIKYGDENDIMYRIEHGVIKPSKTLADSLSSMLSGNKEFILLDDQKVVYEKAIDMSYRGQSNEKQVLIVRGGPGTGKSVVAVNLLVELTKREMLVQYVTKNAAPREVFKSMLKGTKKKAHIDNLFKGSGAYTDTDRDLFDVLIVDEAHRLNEKSGLYGNLGENQVLELIRSSKTSIFFIDEDQRVTFQDIGSIEEIRRFSKFENASVEVMELASQFRCNGSDGYIAWLDDALQIRSTANPSLEGIDYDFRVFDDPVSLRNEIFSKNAINNKARIVAGYCWDWVSKKNPNAFDVVIPEHNFYAKWNLVTDGSLWLVSESSVNEIGCIHTCQGLEVDYVGVIIGKDFVVRNGLVITDALERSSGDRSIRGYKKLRHFDVDEANRKADAIIKNTYRTLMTRGIKGCYIYCVDRETQDYFRSYISGSEEILVNNNSPYPGLEYPVVPFDEAEPYKGYVPVFNVSVAAGSFGLYQNVNELSWVKLPNDFAVSEGMFVARVVGESMNKRIPNGAWCLFKSNPGGTRNGKIVLVQHRDIEDEDTGGSYTIKRYRSEKADNSSENIRIILSPETSAYGYSDIVLHHEADSEFKVIGEFIAVIS